LLQLLVGRVIGKEAAGGAEGNGAGLDARRVAVVAGGLVIDQAELVGEAGDFTIRSVDVLFL
jgi:hypothetical protein